MTAIIKVNSVYVIAIANIYFYDDNMKRKTDMDDFKTGLIFFLHFDAGWTCKQVVQILKTSVNTIKSYCQPVKKLDENRTSERDDRNFLA